MRAWMVLNIGIAWGYAIHYYQLSNWRIFFGSALVMLLADLLLAVFRKKSDVETVISK